MKIFLTGANGYIGGAVLDALVRSGHDVIALVRDKQKAARVATRGGRPLVGNLAEPGSYRGNSESPDAYVHTAFDSAPGRSSAVDRIALESLLELAIRPRPAGSPAESPRVFLYTSGVWVLGNTSRPADEDAPLNPTAIVSWRPEHEQLVLRSAQAGLRSIVVRPGLVYGGRRGIVGDLFKAGLNGLIRVIGDGGNHWPLVYHRDLADLYVRLVTSDTASGVYHANDEGDERVNDLVSAIAAALPMRPDVRHVPIDEARVQMGAYADALALDQLVRSRRARALGWIPRLHSVAGNSAGLLEEFRSGSTG